MSSPSFLLANDSNHDLLQSLLESLNAIIEHKYKSRQNTLICTDLILMQLLENPTLAYAILRDKKRFEALRSFTLESGQQEIERRNRRRKETALDIAEPHSFSRANSIDSIQSPSSIHRRQSTLQNVPEEDGAFAIGDDEDDDTDDDNHTTPAESTPSERGSRAPSISSTVDDAVPVQLRGMSEKARGKMPAGTPTFSRQNSVTSLSSYAAATLSMNGTQFEPSSEWIESWLPELPLHTILTLTEQLDEVVPRAQLTSEIPPASVLRSIHNAPIHSIDASPIRIHSFEWSPLSLGWYESLLWGFVFISEMQVAKGTVGVWNGTSIKLFRVQETAAEGPTLTSPRGAVDAVGSNIVSRIGNINLRANPLVGGQGGQGPDSGNGGGGSGRASISSGRGAVV